MAGKPNSATDTKVQWARLTDLAIERFNKKGWQLADTKLEGFRVKITDAGKKRYIVKKRIAGSKKPAKTITLAGRPPAYTEAAARKEAAGYVLQMDQGIDPSVEIDRRRHQRQEQEEQTVSVLLARYKKDREGDRSFRVLETRLKPIEDRFGSKPVSQVKRPAIETFLEPYRSPDTASAYNVRLRLIRSIFGLGVKLEWITANPTAALDYYGTEPRQRTFSDDEFQQLWNAAIEAPFPCSQWFRLLVASGQRRDEVASAAKSEFDWDQRLWVIPGERMKNGKPHAVPITGLMEEIIREAEAVAATKGLADSPYLFPSVSRRGAPLSGWGHRKNELDKLAPSVTGWVFHDVRRSVRSNLTRLRITEDVAEAVLSHLPARLIRTYNVHTYSLEKRNALERWETLLRSIIAGKPADNVLVMGARA